LFVTADQGPDSLQARAGERRKPVRSYPRTHLSFAPGPPIDTTCRPSGEWLTPPTCHFGLGQLPRPTGLSKTRLRADRFSPPTGAAGNAGSQGC